jgi:hypothetical protein
MRVKCISNKGSGLRKYNIDNESWPRESGIFRITVDKEYIVYCITMLNNSIWYYILQDVELMDYPIWHPAELFEVVDSGMPSVWKFGIQENESNRLLQPMISFPEWASDIYYYDRLTDRDEEAVNIFRRYKEIIDKESI